jgi:hypothetical protein
MSDDLSFEPQKDITAYELALLLRLKTKLLQRETWKTLPPELARHFKDTTTP